MSLRADPTGQPDGALGRRGLLVLFLLALAVRLAALAGLHGSPWNEVLLGDARSFDDWGRRIAAGDWRGEGVFYQAPLYPYFLGAVYACFGHALWLVRGIQIVLGAAASVLIAAGTGRLFSARAGAAAGALSALYGPAIWYDLQIEKTSPAFFLAAGLFYLASARGERPSWRWSLVTGLALAALTLLRENSIVLLAPLSVAFGRERTGRLRALAPLLLGCAAPLLLVAARNLALGGAFLPTAANAGVNFYIGNGADADGQYRPLLAGRGHPDYEYADARRIAEGLSGRELGAGEVSSFWFARAGHEIAAEPAHFVRLLGHKLRLLANRSEIMDAVAIEVFRDESLVLRLLAPLSFGLLLPLALAGALLAWRRPGARLALASALVLALSILAFFVVGRFRLVLVPFLLPFAGLALVELRAVLRRPAALAAGLIGVALAWWPLASEGDARATSLSNLSSELLRRGDFAAAERWARAARERDPASAEAAFNLALALRNQEKDAEAVQPFEEAMRLEPAYAADALAELGALRARAGDRRGARELLERALREDAGHERARAYMKELDAGDAPSSR